MSFRMQTVEENSARIALDQTSFTFRLHELEYLLLNLTTLANQMARYKLDKADVSTYVQSAVVSRISPLLLKNQRVSLSI